jgi:hypothetical protein
MAPATVLSGPLRQRVCQGVAWLSLVNALLGMAPWLWTLGRQDGFPWLGLFGAAAAGLALRGQRAGSWGGVLFYALQLASYYSDVGAWSFSMKAGLSLAIVLRLESGVLVVNAFAALMLVASLAVSLFARRAQQT